MLAASNGFVLDEKQKAAMMRLSSEPGILAATGAQLLVRNSTNHNTAATKLGVGS